MHTSETEIDGLWETGNLHLWEIANWDLVERTSQQRAKLLNKFGIKHYAYLATIDPFGVVKDVNTSQLDFDAEIEAMREHGIDVRGWYFWLNADSPAQDPRIAKALESFGRHQIHPQIWLPQSMLKGASTLYTDSKEGFPSKDAEQLERVRREAHRVAELVKMARPYDCRVHLYNHQGWFGLIENQLAILAELERLGISDVGLVYNLGHSQSAVHDDAKGFDALWNKIKARVATVNLVVRGHREVEMMRVIQASQWKGSVGIVPGCGNMEITISSALWNVRWAAQQLQ